MKIFLLVIMYCLCRFLLVYYGERKECVVSGEKVKVYLCIIIEIYINSRYF